MNSYIPNIIDKNMVTIEYENGKMRVITNWLNPSDFALLFVKQDYELPFTYSVSNKIVRKVLGLDD